MRRDGFGYVCSRNVQSSWDEEEEDGVDGGSLRAHAGRGVVGLGGSRVCCLVCDDGRRGGAGLGELHAWCLVHDAENTGCAGFGVVDGR